MKKIIAFAFAVLMIFSLSACGAKKPTVTAFDENKTSAETVEKSLPFKAQYIRTYGGADSSDYPKTFMISSTNELADYIINKSGDVDAFSEAAEKYGEKFFENHELIAVMLKEGSGSITHEVEKVIFTQSADGRCSVQPVIKRIVPEVGTCDMAYWHILIEIGRDYGKNGLNLLNAEIV